MRSAADLLEELNAVDETARIEAKRASDLGKSLMETVIAFANEPGMDGGYLLLGVDWSINSRGDPEYWAVGLPNPDKVQKDLASQCSSMLSFPLRPEISVERVDGKTLIVVRVAEVDPSHKPVYLRATGLPRGAFRRIGSTDQRCTDEDLWVLRGDTRPQKGPDQSILTDAQPDDFDPAALTEYRRVRSRLNPNAEELGYTDEELLEALGAVRRVDGKPYPTLAGILLFGKSIALRRLLPMVKIDYIRVPGIEWVEDPDQRFQSVEIRKPLLLALPQAEATVVDNTACRDFSGLDTLAASRVLRRLRDRGLLEKQGSGNATYYTLAAGKPNPDGGNIQSALAFELSPSTINTSGSRNEAYRSELATLPPELATLLATLQGRVSTEALRKGILQLCTWEPQTGDQLATLLGKDRHYLRNKHLIPMVRNGALRFLYPESAKHPNQAYITAQEKIEP
jgi:predicted HTH transcriptional regulator